MGTLKLLSIFGTRPEAIKMAPLVQALAREPGIVSLVCVTGQHREMLDQVLGFFGIEPDFDLKLMVRNQSLNALTGAIFTALDPILEAERPDLVLVHGDTTTAMAAGLAAFHRRIRVGHVEAGLRTYHMDRPFPEELNRRVIDVAGALLFAPTARSKDNLLSEHVEGEIVVTGNTVIDALQVTQTRIAADAALRARLDAPFAALDPDKRLILVTGHRRESFGEGFRNICTALRILSERKDVEIVYPVHLNPNVQGPVREALGGRANVHLPGPLDYLSFQRLLGRAHIVLTDSGGVQEEAPTLGKPVLVMREVTERPEALDAGAVILVGTEVEKILAAARLLLDDDAAYARFAECINPYGDGDASRRIVDRICGRPVDEFSANATKSKAAPTLRPADGSPIMVARD
ncbi:UDP-N-acetylglucosamine 2-epimerase (non-hydrolyzing) [Xanthobacter sp. KR7-225]|uniref:non-hydrolyzing UDP-N-acetylglucosamine 2-epimerase n=1 Tax=Xanthobacter sp. KR7-225 TaxID=3156613 RepID=UPI0032B328CB